MQEVKCSECGATAETIRELNHYPHCSNKPKLVNDEEKDLSYKYWVQECVRRDNQIGSLEKLNDELMGQNTKLKKEVFDLKEDAAKRERENWELRKKVNHRNRQGQVIAALENGEILFRPKFNNKQNIYGYDKDGRNPEYLKFKQRHNNDATLTYEMVNKLEDELAECKKFIEVAEKERNNFADSNNELREEIAKLRNKIKNLNHFILNKIFPNE